MMKRAIPLIFLLASAPGCEVIVNLPRLPAPIPVPDCKLPTWVFLAEQNMRWLGPCTTGPGSMTVDRTKICSIFDVDNDWDVDLRDIARLQNKGPYPPQSGTPCAICPPCTPAVEALAAQSVRWFAFCITGPSINQIDADHLCSMFDLDRDEDVDLGDLAVFQNRR